MRKILLFIAFLPLISKADTFSLPAQRIIFSAEVVASACHVRVDADGTGNNLLSFAPYRKASGTAVEPRDFTVRLYESGATIQGCSAFLTGQIATLEFGNPGQLDAGGVVTRGGGEMIRIDVRALDERAGWRGRITDGQNQVNYPVDFATQGQFRFRAQPLFPADTRAGEYEGALSFVVTYQ
ncbi:fimbrial protein [Salmonella enterica]|nr:fimbrial protein [Salmonella enterica]EAQ0971128.1 fimbrial protein [Salmonella enterica]EAT6281938.1 fimbrial protein [Salmonella enterica]EBA8767049.1 fimbrial protein [Salmonella enterica]ECX7382377.1 fimbrial protein [Salmonella enterica]